MPLDMKFQLSTPIPIHSAKESMPELRPGATPPRKTTPKMREKTATVARGVDEGPQAPQGRALELRRDRALSQPQGEVQRPAGILRTEQSRQPHRLTPPSLYWWALAEPPRPGHRSSRTAG